MSNTTPSPYFLLANAEKAIARHSHGSTDAYWAAVRSWERAQAEVANLGKCSENPNHTVGPNACKTCGASIKYPKPPNREVYV